ncbi:corepressor interacting with RBPJ 1 [Narcine bancroftii]|uniref:corepressor interacting with RBPJ 1 n=1 Tax=Narcine bancroftii TaxID=1343680 RepID=UPI0038321C0B
MEDRMESNRKMRQNPSTSSVEEKRDTVKDKRKRKRSRSRSSSVTSTSSSSNSSSSSLSSSSSSRSRNRSSSRESQKKSKNKKRKKEKQHKKRGKKEKKKKQRKKKNICSGPVQISKFLKDRDKSDKYSTITGKKIKMKVKKTRGDKERDRNRAELLQFLNSAM